MFASMHKAAQKYTSSKNNNMILEAGEI